MIFNMFVMTQKPPPPMYPYVNPNEKWDSAIPILGMRLYDLKRT